MFLPSFDSAEKGAFSKTCRLSVWALALGLLFLLFPNLPAQAATDTLALAPSRLEGVVFGLFIGVLLTAATYLFFIWVVMRDRGQIFLMIFLLFLAINMASTNDQLMDQVGQHSMVMRHLLQSYSLILSYIFSIFFTYYFLEIDLNAPHLQKPLFGLAGLLVLLLLYTSFDQRPVYFLLPTLGTLTLGLVLWGGLITLRSGASGSISHIIAFSCFLLGGLGRPLYELGFLFDLDASKNLSYAAFSLAAVLFAIVIAGQFAARQEEKERALAVSNERFALAARGSNEGLFDWNCLSGRVYFSAMFRRIIQDCVGVAPDPSLKGMRLWMAHIVAADRLKVFKDLRRFKKDRQKGTLTISYRLAEKNSDKEPRWIHTKVLAVRHPTTGRVVRFVGSIGDITKEKQNEEQLKASEVRFRSITEAHPVPVMIAGLNETRVFYASPGAEQLLGLPQSVLTSHKLSRFLPKISERQELLDAMKRHEDVDMKEVTLTRGDGNQLPAALSARRIEYQGEAAMVIGVYDLTERKEAEAQIAKQQEALQQSEKMAALGGLLAGVAHELNNPLSVIVGQATLLSEGSDEPRIKTRGEKIFKAADRCSRIVKSFLALARRKPPERKPVDINPLIQGSLELLGYQIRNENITIQMNLAENLPSVRGDGDQLTQVFTNLAMNAAQAMQGWQGKREITITTGMMDESHVMASVSDSGPGVPAEIKTRIFEPFFTTKGNGGTGVGLALCLNIIETHGGHLRLEDTPGGGATFVISLPTAQATEAEAPPEQESTEPLPQGLRVLIVDDEVELAQTLCDLLEPEGCKIAIAHNGELALQALEKDTYDVVISDLRMPVLDGPGLYAGMTGPLAPMRNRIVYVTGDTLSPHVQSFLSSTPVPVIEKPYRLADVRKTVLNLLKEIPTQSNMVPDSGGNPPT